MSDLLKDKELVLEMAFDIARNDWDKFVSDFPQEVSLSFMTDYACAFSELMAEISEYLGQRGGYGCGDHGHEDAMLVVAKHKKKIRKALGYSYP